MSAWNEPIRAAGTVLWRPTGSAAGPDVAVVHRPRYDDWSLPKGKRESGETMPACAVRETLEETGFRPVLGRRLPEVRYQARGGSKIIDYFAGRAGEGEFNPNHEVDEVRWLAPDAAANLLSYAGDRRTLAEFTRLPPNTATLLLVRHAKAGSRTDWEGRDEDRPLSSVGWKQERALRALLPLYGPVRVHAADWERCVRTVAGLAEDLGVPVVEEPLLSEEGYAMDEQAATDRLHALVGRDVAVVCGQGAAIPGLIERLAERSGLRLPPGPLPCKKASVWVLSFAPAAPHDLLATDYLPTPLPTPAVV
jgi:8-oxo-(d)GTP phosphatase